LDLKQSKIHVALLEEQSAERELELQQEIARLKRQLDHASQETVTVNMHTHNVTCFNLGKA